MRSKELSVELRDRLMSRHRSGEGYPNIYAAFKVPKNTVASIILKWKKFGTLLSKRHMTAQLEFAVLWSDETKIELFCLNARHHVWRKPGTISMVKHDGGSIMLWGSFSGVGTGRQVRIEAKMNRAKYRDP
jgi:hypothetical protein